MRINRETDYAIRIVLCLASHNRRISAREIAVEMKITHAFALKILHKLNNNGFVASEQGVAGGYVLLRHPKTISLLDIVEVIDGPIAINLCLQEGSSCERLEKTQCPVHNTLYGLNDVIRKEMGMCKISSLI